MTGCFWVHACTSIGHPYRQHNLAYKVVTVILAQIIKSHDVVKRRNHFAIVNKDGPVASRST